MNLISTTEAATRLGVSARRVVALIRHHWSLRVFWEQPEGPSVAGYFGVEFLPDTDKVLETWSQ